MQSSCRPAFLLAATVLLQFTGLKVLAPHTTLRTSLTSPLGTAADAADCGGAAAAAAACDESVVSSAPVAATGGAASDADVVGGDRADAAAAAADALAAPG